MGEEATYTEKELLEGFRSGRESSFTQLFKALYPALCFYALGYTKDQMVAEDIAAESLVKVWERRENFFQYRALKAYCYKTVRNAAINWTKVQRRRRGGEQEMASNQPASENSPLDNLIRAEVFREIDAALETLPAQCRKIATLLYVKGKTTREIAEELQLSLSAVKTYKARGLIMLRKRLPHLVLILASLTCFF